MKKNISSIIAAFLFSAILWVSVSLSNDYFTTVSIPLKITNIPSGYSLATDLPDKINIKVRGAGWKLVGVNILPEDAFMVSAGNDSGKKFVSLFNSLSENRWLVSDIQVMEIIPDTISFYIEKVATRVLPVVSNVEMNFRAGFGLAQDVKLYPDTIIVTGPKSIINKLSEIKTVRKSFSSLDSRLIEKVELENIPGTTYSINQVSVEMNVQKIVDKRIDDIFVKVLDVPTDRDVVVIPNKINISVRGGINILGRLNKEDFDAYVYFRDVVFDTLGSVKPNISLPNNTVLVDVKPERLRYIIKKF